MGAELTGDWAQVKKLLQNSSKKVANATNKALRQEAELLRKEIVQGITKQAPGGKAFNPPLAELTLVARKLKGRGGSKTLIVRGDLRNAVAAIMKSDEAFVGVPRNAVNKDGKSLVDVAKVQEFGAGPIIIPMTPAMRRFLFMLIRQSGQEPQSDGSGSGVVVISIPARPFLQPAFKEFVKGADKRFLERVARLIGFADGTLGGI